MVRLEKSEVLGRKIRKDSAEELVIPTWNLVSKAIEEGRTEEALELMEYGRIECANADAALIQIIDSFLTTIAENFGEDQVEKVWKRFSEVRLPPQLAAAKSVEETIQQRIEVQRGHGCGLSGKLSIKEEADRYVLTCDPCATGGRLWRTRKVGTTKKAYPWSWSKVGIPYYCSHCCLQLEIMPIELRGYPMRIIERSTKPEDPCIHLFYKKPEFIPEKYFTRIGMKKKI